MLRKQIRAATIALILASTACPSDPVAPLGEEVSGDLITVDDGATPDWLAEPDLPPVGATAPRFEPAGGFFAAPFPIETRRRADSSVDVSDFPNPDGNALLEGYLEVVDAAPEGFSRNGSVLFPFDGPIDPATLPQSLADSVSDDASVLFLDVDPESPERGRRFEAQVAFADTPAKLRPQYLLTVLPYPGLVLRPDNLYAAVVLDTVRDPQGLRLARPAAMDELLAGQPTSVPAALGPPFVQLSATLTEQAVSPTRVVVATVFRTGHPTASTRAVVEYAASLPAPDYNIVERIRDYPTLCVLEGRTTVPIFQAGERTYQPPGSGQIVFQDGLPVVQWSEEVRFSLSIPKRDMPDSGFPLLLYSAGQGGAYTQVIDRGTFAEQEADPENGRGPAFYFADVGIASFGVEAALVGPRHPDGSFAGLDFFNFFNLTAFRDNIRQAAAEFAIYANLAKQMQIQIGPLCDGVNTTSGAVRFDPDNLFFYGHSTGSTIGDLVLALVPAYRGGLLSGAGGSWIYNIALKQHPVVIADIVSLALDLDEPLDAFHPLPLLFQMAIEPAEALNFAPLWQAAGAPSKDVLLLEGVVDLYFLPRMVSALAMAARLDLAGQPAHPDILADLALVDTGPVPLPAGPNRGSYAGYHAQFLAEGFDGHYAPFELGAPKHTYKCFFDAIVRKGEADVPIRSDDGAAACPQ